MALGVKLEYVSPKDSDEGVMWHLRKDPPAYLERTGKEEYYALDAEDQDDFLTGLFEIEGVTEVSCKAHRIWVMKSPVYNWSEINNALEEYLLDQFSETETEFLLGSAKKDGTGDRLSSTTIHREL